MNKKIDFLELDKFFKENERGIIKVISSPKQYGGACHTLGGYTDERFQARFFDFKASLLGFDFEKILSYEKIQNGYKCETKIYSICYILTNKS